MTDRLLIDLDTETVSVSYWSVGEPPEAVTRARLEWPLDELILEDLRWYLEDYLRAPFGVWEDRGPRIHKQLRTWGNALFACVFHDDPAREAFQRAKDQGLELVFRSANPAILGRPWELMHDTVEPVALACGGLSRAVPVADLARTAEIPGGRLRVLMVISRPAGTRDIEYRMVARPLLERLDAVRHGVDLVVLRPPTLQALRVTLTDAMTAGKPFQVVHFDGHGALLGRPVDRTGSGRQSFQSLEEGVLSFERQAGGSHEVRISKLAAVLKEAGVAVAVLNACQSGAVGKDLEAAIATRLLRDGVASVVAMAYNVYAVAAAEFMTLFYERLFAGDTVGAAVKGAFEVSRDVVTA